MHRLFEQVLVICRFSDGRTPTRCVDTLRICIKYPWHLSFAGSTRYSDIHHIPVQPLVVLISLIQLALILRLSSSYNFAFSILYQDANLVEELRGIAHPRDDPNLCRCSNNKSTIRRSRPCTTTATIVFSGLRKEWLF